MAKDEWMDRRRATEVAETHRLARQAVELGKKDAVALSMGGFALAFVVGEVEVGAAFIDRALILNQNLATGWLLSGWVNSWLGKPEVQVERATRAIRLSPLDPFTFPASTLIGARSFLCLWAEKGLLQQPNSAARGAHCCGKPRACRAAGSSAQGRGAAASDRSDVSGLRSQANVPVSPARPRKTRRGPAKSRAAGVTGANALRRIAAS